MEQYTPLFRTIKRTARRFAKKSTHVLSSLVTQSHTLAQNAPKTFVFVVGMFMFGATLTGFAAFREVAGRDDVTRSEISSRLSGLYFPSAYHFFSSLGITSLPSFRTAVAAPQSPTPPPRSASVTSTTSTANTNDILSDADLYRDLPVAHVKTLPSSSGEAWGTVVFLPQYHRTPGTDALDPVNDRAEVTQYESYEILKKLVEEASVDLIAVEGELEGYVPTDKRETVAYQMEARANAEQELDSLKNLLADSSLNPSLEQRVTTGLDEELKNIDREIVLTGAPFMVWANDPSLTFVGSENPETRKESEEVVRNYIYLQDRLQAVSHSASPLEHYFRNLSQYFLTGGQAGEMSLIELLLSRMDGYDGYGGHSSLDHDIRALADLASQNGRSDIADALSRSVDAIIAVNEPPAYALSYSYGQHSDNLMTTASAPSRADNPYQNIHDPQQLKRLLDEAEQQIEEVVIERRDQEAAEIFAKALRDHSKDAGVLQYGVGHSEGLIRELRAQGLNVVVVVPNEVARHSDEALVHIQ